MQSRTSTSLRHLRREFLHRFKKRYNSVRKTRRPYVYEDTFNEIMLWGREAVRGHVIPRPPNNKDNFPYYLELYIKHLKENQQ